LALAASIDENQPIMVAERIEVVAKETMVDNTGGPMQDDQRVSPAAFFNEQASVSDLYVMPFAPDSAIVMSIVCLTCS
jgi:hypothetical protein